MGEKLSPTPIRNFLQLSVFSYSMMRISSCSVLQSFTRLDPPARVNILALSSGNPVKRVSQRHKNFPAFPLLYLFAFSVKSENCECQMFQMTESRFESATFFLAGFINTFCESTAEHFFIFISLKYTSYFTYGKIKQRKSTSSYACSVH